MSVVSPQNGAKRANAGCYLIHLLFSNPSFPLVYSYVHGLLCCRPTTGSIPRAGKGERGEFENKHIFLKRI
jgi:hypothetical protein